MKAPARSMRRLWGLIHVRPLAVIIGFAEIFSIIIQTLIVGSFLPFCSTVAIYITAAVLTILAVFLLLAGIFYRVPWLLGPHLVMQIVTTVILFLLAAGSVICLTFGTSVHVRFTVVHSTFSLISDPAPLASHFNIQVVFNALVWILLGIAIITILVLLLTIWSITVVLDCRHFLSTYEARKKTVFELVRSEGKARDNMRHYGVEGGGEADNDQYSIITLRKPIVPT